MNGAQASDVCVSVMFCTDTRNFNFFEVLHLSYQKTHTNHTHTHTPHKHTPHTHTHQTHTPHTPHSHTHTHTTHTPHTHTHII